MCAMLCDLLEDFDEIDRAEEVAPRVVGDQLSVVPVNRRLRWRYDDLGRLRIISASLLVQIAEEAAVCHFVLGLYHRRDLLQSEDL